MKTIGHSEAQPGLRGHSIDAETFPWRVVCGYWRTPEGALLDTWEVEGTDGVVLGRYREVRDHWGDIVTTSGTACDRAHALARRLKRLFPEGKVTDDRNIGGDPATVAERLAGCLLTVQLSPYEKPIKVRVNARQRNDGILRAWAANAPVQHQFKIEELVFRKGARVAIERLDNEGV